jgi:hypothetical protein
VTQPSGPTADPTDVPAPRPYTVAPAGPPTDVVLRPLDGDVLDETAFRRFMARHAAAQALSAQRTEYYLRSMHTYVMWWFWLTIIGAVVAGIWLGVSLSEADTPSSRY